MAVYLPFAPKHCPTKLMNEAVNSPQSTGHGRGALPARYGSPRVHCRWAAPDEDIAASYKSICDAAPFTAYHQCYEIGEAVRAIGGLAYRARLYDGEQLIGVAQALVHKLFGGLAIIHVMRGPVWAKPSLAPAIKAAAIEAMHETVPAKGPFVFLVSPEHDADDGLACTGMKRVFGGYHTGLVDLTAPEDDILKNLNGKWRNRLRTAQSENITVNRLARDPLKYAWLLDKDAQLMKRLRHQSSNVALVPAFHNAAGGKSIFAYEAKDGDTRLAGMLFLRHGACATYHIGWSGAAGKSLNAHNLLMWDAIRDLKKAGVCVLDLGGVDTDYNPGIARFKLGTGAKVVSSSGSWTKGPRWR